MTNEYNCETSFYYDIEYYHITIISERSLMTIPYISPSNFPRGNNNFFLNFLFYINEISLWILLVKNFFNHHKCIWDSFILLHVSIMHSFLFILSGISLYQYSIICLSIFFVTKAFHRPMLSNIERTIYLHFT